MISMVQRSPTTDSVRATEQVIASICCQRIYPKFRTSDGAKPDSQLKVINEKAYNASRGELCQSAIHSIGRLTRSLV
jgi:hypothetical protein